MNRIHSRSSSKPSIYVVIDRLNNAPYVFGIVLHMSYGLGEIRQCVDPSYAHLALVHVRELLLNGLLLRRVRTMIICASCQSI